MHIRVQKGHVLGAFTYAPSGDAPMGKLTEMQCRSEKPREKAYKLFDGGGLYLEVMSTGSKLWRLKYYYLGKEKRLALGSYPKTSLKYVTTSKWIG